MLLVWDKTDLFPFEVSFELLCPFFFCGTATKPFSSKPIGYNTKQEHREQHCSENVDHDIIEQRVVGWTNLCYQIFERSYYHCHSSYNRVHYYIRSNEILNTYILAIATYNLRRTQSAPINSNPNEHA